VRNEFSAVVVSLVLVIVSPRLSSATHEFFKKSLFSHVCQKRICKASRSAKQNLSCTRQITVLVLAG
jgi:hypothetical protein